MGDRVAVGRLGDPMDESTFEWLPGCTLVEQLDGDKWTVRTSSGSTISCTENDFDLETVEVVA